MKKTILFLALVFIALRGQAQVKTPEMAVIEKCQPRTKLEIVHRDSDSLRTNAEDWFEEVIIFKSEWDKFHIYRKSIDYTGGWPLVEIPHINISIKCSI